MIFAVFDRLLGAGTSITPSGAVAYQSVTQRFFDWLKRLNKNHDYSCFGKFKCEDYINSKNRFDAGKKQKYNKQISKQLDGS